MAERTQYQYTPLVGPVWREPVAEKLAWLPSGQRPVRGLPPNRLGDFVRPEFEALYKPERLEWSPSDRYAGRAIPRELIRWYVLDPIPPAAPQHLTWIPAERYSGKPLPKGRPDYTIWPPFESLYDPEGLQWLPSAQQPSRGLAPNKVGDFADPQFAALPAPSFDPQDLEWIPKGTAPQVPLERRKLGDFQQPPFSSLYNPQTLEWIPGERYFGRALPRSLNDQTVLVQLVLASVFDPQNLEWIPKGTAPQISVERRILGDFKQPSLDALYRPEGIQWLLQGQQPSRITPFVRQGSWVVDPTTPAPAPEPVVIIERGGGDGGRKRKRRKSSLEQLNELLDKVIEEGVPQAPPTPEVAKSLTDTLLAKEAAKLQAKLDQDIEDDDEEIIMWLL